MSSFDTLPEVGGILNTSIDWTVRENVQAKMRIAVKRILRIHGYPPDMQVRATETVMQQAKLLAEQLNV